MKKRRADQSEDSAAVQRLDKWLWAARFFKTRRLASEAVLGGKVYLDGQRVKPAKGIKPGVRLHIKRGEFNYVVLVKQLNEQRRPAKEACLLYEETAESKAERENKALQLREIRLADRLIKGDGKPNKKQRREIVNFRKF